MRTSHHLLLANLTGLGIVATLVATACSTGNGQYCNGRPAADCQAQIPNAATGGSSNVGGANSGGSISNSSTVLRIIGNSLRDVSNGDSVANPDAVDVGADGGPDSGIVADGLPVILRGVNRSGTEYKCAQSSGIFDGPSDEASVMAMKSWNINAVRIPLNESCWLAPPEDDAPNLNPYYSGARYKQAIQDYVELLHKYDIYPILELHWVAPKGQVALSQMPMPDADHAEDLWKDITLSFKDDLGVIFELYNEPFPDGNRDTDAAWACWRDGCTSDIWGLEEVDGGTAWRVISSYQAVGFQKLVDAVRSVEGPNSAASHVILLGGVQYSNALTKWTEYRPHDPANNLGAAWHIYNFNKCSSTSCYEGVPLTLSQTTYLLPSEIGQNDCKGDIVSTWMNWFDSHGMGYLAWSWNVNGTVCEPGATNGSGGNPWSLINDFNSGTPMGEPGSFGHAIHDHLVSLK